MNKILQDEPLQNTGRCAYNLYTLALLSDWCLLVLTTELLVCR